MVRFLDKPDVTVKNDTEYRTKACKIRTPSSIEAKKRSQNPGTYTKFDTYIGIRPK